MIISPPAWVSLLLAFVVTPVVAGGLYILLNRLFDRLLRARHAPVLRRLVRDGRISVALSFALLSVLLALPALDLPNDARSYLTRGLGLMFTACLGWALTRKVAAIFDAYLDQMRALGEGDLLSRQRRTQLVIFRRLVVSAGVVLTVGLVLTGIPAVRTVGVSLFASAGVAGIVAGLAARPTVSNLVAGLQLALTQPIRIGDAVVIEGEWGHVDEIGSTFVIVTTWDQRSLIIPLTYFLERPIRNWTRASSQLLDTVFLYVDYTVPVEAIRQGARKIVENSALWDERAFAVQVTDLRERTMELRVLISAADAGRIFDLRCLVREQLIAFVVANYPDSLARDRLELNRQSTTSKPGQPNAASADRSGAAPLASRYAAPAST